VSEISEPGLETELCDRWQLERGPDPPGALLTSVRAVRRVDGTEAVLKLARPGDRIADELACLRLWAGGPSPSVLEADEERGAILLERIVPGTRAIDADPGCVASLLRRIHLPAVAGLPPLREAVLRRLDHAEHDGRASAPRLAWARTAVERLHENAPAPVVVHGDFDERNLLHCDRRGVCAIDPLPCAGDGTYDAASWIHANRRPGRRARFDALAAAAALDRGRLRDWCGVVAVHG
jgi:streptomycin 6-kinase